MVRLSKVDPEGIEANLPEYRNIIGFRNVIAHGYDIIDQVVLWDFVVNKVPELLEKVRDYWNYFLIFRFKAHEILYKFGI